MFVETSFVETSSCLKSKLMQLLQAGFIGCCLRPCCLPHVLSTQVLPASRAVYIRATCLTCCLYTCCQIHWYTPRLVTINTAREEQLQLSGICHIMRHLPLSRGTCCATVIAVFCSGLHNKPYATTHYITNFPGKW